jgi:hypothetical protein
MFSVECLPVCFAREERGKTSSWSRRSRTTPNRIRSSGIVEWNGERFLQRFLGLVRSGLIRDIEVGVGKVDLATKSERLSHRFVDRIFVRPKFLVFRCFSFAQFYSGLRVWLNDGECLHLFLPFLESCITKLVDKCIAARVCLTNIIIYSIVQLFLRLQMFFSSRPMADEFRIIDINKLPKSKLILVRLNKIKTKHNSPICQLLINETVIVACFN